MVVPTVVVPTSDGDGGDAGSSSVVVRRERRARWEEGVGILCCNSAGIDFQLGLLCCTLLFISSPSFFGFGSSAIIPSIGSTFLPSASTCNLFALRFIRDTGIVKICPLSFPPPLSFSYLLDEREIFFKWARWICFE